MRMYDPTFLERLIDLFEAIFKTAILVAIAFALAFVVTLFLNI